MVTDIRTINELDPKKKTVKWGMECVSHFRLLLQPICSAKKYLKNRETLFGNYSMQPLRELFKHPDKSGVNFIALAIMEKLRNVLIAEAEEAGINVTLVCTDPTATTERDHDKALLANRKLIEGTMSYLRGQIGMAPYSLADKKKKDGRPLFNGNVTSFDEMGLDDTSSEDINFFFATFHRLMYEIKAEEPINYYFQLNEVVEYIALWVNDILSVKTVASRAYVSENSGAIEIKYVQPTAVRAVHRKRRDFKDSPAMGIEETVTISEALAMMGSDFDPETDMKELLNAANFSNGTSYRNLVSDDRNSYHHFHGQPYATCTYSQLLGMEVSLGYIEWKSNEQDARKVTDSDAHGNMRMYEVELTRKLAPDSGFSKKVWNTECTYKAYYLPTSATTERIFKFGKLSYPLIEGSDDEYSGFSIMAVREPGKSAAEIAEPHIIAIEKAFKKCEFLIAKVKPDGRAYNYESLLAIAENMYPEETAKNAYGGIKLVLKSFFDGANEIYTSPTTSEGEPVGGGGQASYPVSNGVSKSVMDLKEIANWRRALIDDELGISKLRDGSSPAERDGFKLNMQSLASSQNATQYIMRMLMTLFNSQAKRVTFFTQAIVNYAPKSSLPYKHMLQAIGDETMETIKNIGKRALHRMGIFVESINLTSARQEAKSIAFNALQQGQIDLSQYQLVISHRNPKRIVQVLDYEKRRKERLDMKKTQQAQQAQQAIEQAKLDHEKAMEQMKIDGRIREREIQAQADIRTHEITVDGMLKKEAMHNEQKTRDITDKVDADADRKANEENLAAQRPLVS